MTEPRVFFANEPKHSPHHTPRDVSSAKAFGDIHYLFTINDDPPSKSVNDATEHLMNKLTELDFDPEKDYIAWAGGDPMALFLIGVALGTLWDEVSFLSWDRVWDDKAQENKSQYVHKQIAI